MIDCVQMRHAMKTSVSSVILLSLFALCAHGGEVERFIHETLEEQRARNATESSEVGKIIDDAIKGQKMPELELPKESVFTSKDKERDARYYKYDKTGKLISVEYAAKPEKNEYYAYDRQGNIIEKRMGDKVYKYAYDTGNQLKEMSSPEGKREYFYDRAGRLVSEKLNGEIDVEYKYGYLDKVIEVNRRGKITKFAYDGFGMLAQKTFHDGSTEVWVWDGLALIRRGSDIYVNEPHVSGGVPILSKTAEGVRYHEHDFLGTTLWSTDTKGNIVKDYQDTTIFGEGSIQKDRSARFTGKPYDEDLQAYVFPYRNYDATTARWRSSDPAGYPDGINNQFYAAIPTISIDILGLDIYHVLAPSGGIGYGHSAWIVGNSSSGYSVYSYGSSSSGGTYKQSGISTLAGAYAALKESGTGQYEKSQRLITSPETDSKFITNADNYIKEAYNAGDHNCYDLGPEGLKGTKDENKISKGNPNNPNTKFIENLIKGWIDNSSDVER